MLTKDHNIIRGAREILKLGKFSLIIKRGGYGAILFTKQKEVFAIPAFPLENVVDPTGAGDCFAGACMGFLARTRAARIDEPLLRRALLHGSVVASFGVENFSTERLERLTQDEIGARTEALRKMCAV